MYRTITRLMKVASAATLEQGLHIMTPHDLVAFLTLGED